MLAGIDVFGFYTGSTVAGTPWVQQATSARVPSAYLGTPFLAGGLRGGAIDPSNNQHMIAFYGISAIGGSLSTLWYTANGGTSWIQSGNFPFTNDSSNGTGRFAGQRMAIDPANSDIAYVGSQNGVYKTTNLTAGAATT